MLPRKATIQSWTITYVGNASELLYEHLAHYQDNDKEKYANYTSIVQSSGMGKSRGVDELSKTRLVVSLVLSKEATGVFS
jgi:subtilisin-like proprotein convertase family protein